MPTVISQCSRLTIHWVIYIRQYSIIDTILRFIVVQIVRFRAYQVMSTNTIEGYFLIHRSDNKMKSLSYDHFVLVPLRFKVLFLTYYRQFRIPWVCSDIFPWEDFYGSRIIIYANRIRWMAILAYFFLILLNPNWTLLRSHRPLTYCSLHEVQYFIINRSVWQTNHFGL